MRNAKRLIKRIHFIRNSSAVMDLFSKVVLPADDVYIYALNTWFAGYYQHRYIIEYNTICFVTYFLLHCALGISFNLGLSDAPYILNMSCIV